MVNQVLKPVIEIIGVLNLLFKSLNLVIKSFLFLCFLGLNLRKSLLFILFLFLQIFNFLILHGLLLLLFSDNGLLQ